jgi:acetyl-CoA carboxylase biotin carboxyl carrier protein
MDRDRILSLLGLLKSSSAAELAVGEGEFYVRLRRQMPPGPPSSGATTGQTTVSAEPGPATAPAEDTLVVRARLVGFFHRGQGPETEPLVEVGDRVEAGQTIGTIESLRQITAVTAPVSGTVVEIVAEEHQPVQFGDALIVLKPQSEE